MTDKEAIAQLSALVGWVIPASGGPVWYAEIMGEAVRVATEAIERNQWTPCSERLPEGGEEVLGTDDKGSVWMVFMRSNFKTGESCFETAEEGMLIDIAAWMPLPEPYKGGER